MMRDSEAKIEYKEIQLTQAKTALINAEDYKWLNQWKWYAQRGHNRNFYAVRGIKKNGKQISLFMHREILKTPEGLYTDHLNGNGLDNRRDNLRICTRSQNQINRKTQKNNKSGHRGVSFYKRDKKWKAQIRRNNQKIYLGVYFTKKEAAKAYNAAAKKYYDSN